MTVKFYRICCLTWLVLLAWRTNAQRWQPVSESTAPRTEPVRDANASFVTFDITNDHIYSL